MKTETLTLVLVNLAGIMDRADVSVLPGVYKEVGAALHLDPTGLGSLTLFRSLVQSLCYPLAAYLAMRHNRAHVIALGAFLWAAATFLFAISTTFPLAAISRGLNGIGLAIVIPAIQSLVADSTDDNNRGVAFGWLQLTGDFGSIIGGLCSVLIASTSFAGIAGWRLAFHLVGLISVIVGILVCFFANDPRFSKSDGRDKYQISDESFLFKIKGVMEEAKSVLKIRTFQILVAQGVPGSFPGRALSFAPLWLELTGFSHAETATLWTLYVLGRSFGALLGGKMGDILAQRLRNSGRIMLSQISSGSGIPLAAILLLGLPDDPNTAVMHGLVLFIMGLSTSWNAPATNNPIFAEIVPEKSRTCIYALDRSLESIWASFAPLIVGVLVQNFYGYKLAPQGSLDPSEIETDRENAASLAKALYTAIGIPMAISCSIYSFLYCTYPRDRDRARMVPLKGSEMQQLEEAEAGCQVHVLESSGKESINNIEIDYDYAISKEESLDLDDSDEKSLLSRELTFSNLGE